MNIDMDIDINIRWKGDVNGSKDYRGGVVSPLPPLPRRDPSPASGVNPQPSTFLYIYI
jgi:hypothetical protein